MKTLDEVITALEYCTGFDFVRCQDCPGYSEPDCGVQNDALHYLKAYRENQHAYEEGNRKAEEARERYLEAVKNCELAENKYKRLYGGTSQKLRNTSQITCPKCHSEFVILPESNEPLSWDELRTMEGKPVWVESQRFGNHWYLNRGIKDESCLYFVGHYGENVLLYDDDMGTLWQAYRKERDDRE